MPMLDVFRSDAFSVVSLTDAILKVPHKPGRIGVLGLFQEKAITSTTVVVEEKDGRLSLIAATPRGGSPSTIGAQKRTARSFVVPHLERESVVMADEVQNVRSFGSENDADAVVALVNERLEDLRSMHDVTLEYHRVGAIKGQILDADGASVLFNLFTEFGVAQNTLDIALSNAATNVRNRAVAIQRAVETELGGEPITGYRAFCGDNFFDKLVGHAKVEASLQYQESALLRTDLRSGFEFGGIVWENYRGKVLKPDGSASVDFFPTEEAYVVPIGPRIFRTAFAPADFIETVNTPGLPVYAKIAIDDQLNRWAKVHTQSNPMCLCLRPRAVIKVTNS